MENPSERSDLSKEMLGQIACPLAKKRWKSFSKRGRCVCSFKDISELRKKTGYKHSKKSPDWILSLL